MKTRIKAGFTLIELLVVIAIVSLLAALLLPVLAGAKAKARSTQCQVAVRTLAQGMTIYAHDNEDMLPRENGGNGSNSWPVVAASTNRDVWYNVVLDKPAYAYEPTLESQRSFHHPSSLFTCGSARLNRDDAARYPNFSHGINSRLRIGTGLARLSDFTDTTRTPFFLDGGVSGEKPLAGQLRLINAYDGRPHVKWDRASARHNGRANVSFPDGSVSPILERDLTNAAPTDVIRWEP